MHQRSRRPRPAGCPPSALRCAARVRPSLAGPTLRPEMPELMPMHRVPAGVTTPAPGIAPVPVPVPVEELPPGIVRDAQPERASDLDSPRPITTSCEAPTAPPADSQVSFQLSTWAGTNGSGPLKVTLPV